MIGLDPMYVESVVRAALVEDIGSGDITTIITVPGDALGQATLTAKEAGVIAGQQLAKAAFGQLEGNSAYEPVVADGKRVEPGDIVGTISADAKTILTGERVALNFLQQMSGIATLTSMYVELVKHTKARIVDTRKTIPGLRRLQKYAVCIGGGQNHRFGLDDGILIKDNHIAACGGIAAAIGSARTYAPHTLKIEIEVRNMEQLNEALSAGADVVLLDNMTLDDMRKSVKLAQGKALVEASGGVNLDTVRDIAETGIDIISIGALTHSAPALDISLNFTGEQW